MTTFFRLVAPSLSFQLEQLIEAETSEHKKESTIMTQKMRFVGIDIGKFDFYAFCSISGQIKAFGNTESGHEDLIKWLEEPAGTIIALEPTGGYEWALWQALDGAGFDARQVSAAHVRAFARAGGALAKTDPIDATLIADFIAFRPDAGRKVPADNIRQISALASKRRQLVAMKRSLSCQEKQRHVDGFEAMDEELMALLKTQIKELEARIQKQISKDVQLARQAEILRSIPGIGPVLSAALIAQMTELGSCTDKQIAALAGVAPINNDSGKKEGKRSIRGGRYEVRCLLYQAALVASNHNPVLKIFAKRLRDKGKPHKVVLIAVARKLLTIANTLIAKNQLWSAA